VHGNETYENASLELVRGALAPDSPFLEQFRPIARRLAFLGMLTGLARTALKCTIPGVPDFYQGTERWDLSLVDPDNRRPVDYAARIAALDEESSIESLLDSWSDGRIKQRLAMRILADRVAAPALYASGDYEPLKVQDGRAAHVVAFARTCGNEHLAVVVPRLMNSLAEGEAIPLGARAWGETRVEIPPGPWHDLFTGAEIEAAENGVLVSELFKALPISVLRASR
jgi:(1->4)-alpha-D-glucan 1-alpha-D-glucosylmutase